MDETLGMIGLGRMGAPMAARLVGAGHAVLGYDQAGTAERLPPGVRAAESVAALAAEAQAVFLSLPDGAACLAVCDDLVAAPATRRPRAVVNLSTVGVPAAEACADRLAAAGIASLDAPVSGGVAGAVSGGLAMMVGGEASLYADVRPLLVAIARNCFRVGDRAGQGQAMKLLNNYVSAAAMAATSEAVLCGTRLGLDPAQVVEILNVSSGRTTASTDKFPRSVLPRSFDFGFAGALMAKDVALYLEQAERAGAPREVATAVTGLWERFNCACPSEDFTAIYRYLEGGG
jgi:3-hydroxyisobutyrate dehydrogenase-like beta-hydroxyacid dehydrogenase